MRDHLYRLAAHALDRLPAAAPRVGSRFEPVAEDEPPAAEAAPGAAEPAVADLAPRRPPAPPAAPSRQPPVALDDRPVATAPTDMRRPLDAVPSTPDPAAADPFGPAPRASAAAPTMPDDSGSPRPATAPVAANGTTAGADFDTDGDAATRASDDEETARPKPAGPGHRTTAAARPPTSPAADPGTAPTPLPTVADAARRSPAEEVPPVRTVPAEGDDADALFSPEVPEPRSAAGSLPLPTPAAPETTIHVSIGRIEVRATPPVALPPPAAKAPAVMGLDDYLRRRGGGGRS